MQIPEKPCLKIASEVTKTIQGLQLSTISILLVCMSFREGRSSAHVKGDYQRIGDVMLRNMHALKVEKSSDSSNSERLNALPPTDKDSSTWRNSSVDYGLETHLNKNFCVLLLVFSRLRVCLCGEISQCICII